MCKDAWPAHSVVCLCAAPTIKSSHGKGRRRDAKADIQAFLIADLVDRETAGKWIICGVFGQLFSDRFPTRFGRSVFAFVSLTEVHGRTELILRYIDLQTNEVLLQSQPVSLESGDPLAPVEAAFEVPPLPMPHEGVYSLELWSGDEMLGATRLKVSKLERLSQ